MYRSNKNVNEKIFISLVIALIMLMSCFITACQPTPEDSIVQGNKGKMFEIIGKDGGNQNLNIPISHKTTITSNNGDVEVFVDAAVSAEQADSYPVYTLKPMDISDEDAAEIMYALFGDRELYDLPVYGGDFTLGKDYLGYAINLLQARLESADEEGSKEYIRELMGEFQTMYVNAPETMYTVPALKTFSAKLAKESLLGLEQEWREGTITDEEEYNRVKEAYENAIKTNTGNLTISGIVDLGAGMQGQLNIHKSDDNKNNFVEYHVIGLEEFVEMDIGFNSDDDSSHELTISEEEAISMADKLISDMGIEYMGLGNVGLEDTVKGTEYWLVYYRDMDGTMSSGAQGADSGLAEYRASWSQEEINIFVNDDGISIFEWKSPSELVEKKTDNVTLLDFDEAMRIFSQQILANTAYAGNDSEYVTHRQYVIDTITLSTMTVPQPNNQNEYIAVPVWDFGGYHVITYSDAYQNYVREHGGYQVDEKNQRKVDESGLSYLTINAIDGSIIDRSVGY